MLLYKQWNVLWGGISRGISGDQNSTQLLIDRATHILRGVKRNNMKHEHHHPLRAKDSIFYLRLDNCCTPDIFFHFHQFSTFTHFLTLHPFYTLSSFWSTFTHSHPCYPLSSTFTHFYSSGLTELLHTSFPRWFSDCLIFPQQKRILRAETFPCFRRKEPFSAQSSL